MLVTFRVPFLRALSTTFSALCQETGGNVRDALPFLPFVSPFGASTDGCTVFYVSLCLPPPCRRPFK